MRPNKLDAGGRLFQVDRQTAADFLNLARQIMDARIGEPILLSAEQARRQLGLGESLFRKLTNAGEIPAVRVEGRVLYRPEALRDWAAARETGGNEKSGGT